MTHKLKAIIKWKLRAWPLLLYLLLLSVHFAFIYFPCINDNLLCWNNSEINKFTGLILQLLGGALVIYSIDSNLGVFKGNNLKHEFISYLREFPLIKRNINIQAGSGSYTITGHPATITVTRNPTSIEEHIEYLQEQIEEIKIQQQSEYKELQGRIAEVSEEAKKKI